MATKKPDARSLDAPDVPIDAAPVLPLGALPPGATRAGLPNTCSVCGKGDLVYWYADNDDAAIAGQGRCEDCDGLHLRPQ